MCVVEGLRVKIKKNKKKKKREKAVCDVMHLIGNVQCVRM